VPAIVNAKQAAHLAESFAKGTAEAGEIARTVLADKVRELI
jgi:hypothetical protein